MRQVVLDTETTGLQIEQGHRLIEIAGIELVNRKFTGKRFHYYINPERDIEEGAFAVHGISTEFLRDKPKFPEIAEAFMEFVMDAELVIHNAPFDVGFINHELKLTNKKFPAINQQCRVVDTLVLARQLHVGQRNSLDALCKRYHIDNSQRELHGALLDAHLLAQVYLAMTGGQSSLFEELQSTPLSVEEKASVAMPIQQRNLLVINASQDELNLHEEKLTAMSAKGNCLWNQLVN